MPQKLLFLSFFILYSLVSSNAQAQSLLREFPVEEARQAVAVDAAHFYVVNNSTLRKYRKDTGVLVTSRDGTNEGIVHLVCYLKSK